MDESALLAYAILSEKLVYEISGQLLYIATNNKDSDQPLCHYENKPIQIYRKFHLPKTENFQIKNSDIFLISAQNIDCGYSLELPL